VIRGGVDPASRQACPLPRDSDLIDEGVRNPEAQRRIQAAIKRAFQTRDAEMAVSSMLADLERH
jgi:hypothetical protein